MNKNEKMSFLKGKGAAIGIVVCFMAVLAVCGTYTVGNYKKDMKEQMAKAEKEAEQFTEDNTKETTTDEILLPEVEETDENEQESREDVPDTTGKRRVKSLVFRRKRSYMACKRSSDQWI